MSPGKHEIVEEVEGQKISNKNCNQCRKWYNNSNYQLSFKKRESDENLLRQGSRRALHKIEQ